MRRFVLLGLCTLLCLVTLSGCGDSVTEEQARTLLSDLIPRAREWNDIFFGEGPQVLEQRETTATGGVYAPLAEGFAYRTVGEMKEAAEQVFSKDYLEHSVYPMAFDGVDGRDPRYAERDGVLCRNVALDVFDVSGTIDPSSARVTQQGFGVVTLEVAYRKGDSRLTVNLTLRQQGDTWLLDSPTY